MNNRSKIVLTGLLFPACQLFTSVGCLQDSTSIGGVSEIAEGLVLRAAVGDGNSTAVDPDPNKNGVAQTAGSQALATVVCPAWRNNVTYQSGNKIVYNGQAYVANRFVYLNTPPIDSDQEWFWSPIDAALCLQGNTAFLAQLTPEAKNRIVFSPTASVELVYRLRSANATAVAATPMRSIVVENLTNGTEVYKLDGVTVSKADIEADALATRRAIDLAAVNRSNAAQARWSQLVTTLGLDPASALVRQSMASELAIRSAQTLAAHQTLAATLGAELELVDVAEVLQEDERVHGTTATYALKQLVQPNLSGGKLGEGIGVWHKELRLPSALAEDALNQSTWRCVNNSNIAQTIDPSFAYCDEPSRRGGHPAWTLNILQIASPKAMIYASSEELLPAFRGTLDPPVYLGSHSWSQNSLGKYEKEARNWDNETFLTGIAHFMSVGNGDLEDYAKSPSIAYNLFSIGMADFGPRMHHQAKNPSNGVEKPDFVAPGWRMFGGTIHPSQGTSGSTPLVAGVAARMLSDRAELRNHPQALRAAMLVGKLHNYDGSKTLSDHDGYGQFIYDPQGMYTWMSVLEGPNASWFDANQEITYTRSYTAGNRVQLALSWLVSGDAVFADNTVSLPNQPSMFMSLTATCGSQTYTAARASQTSQVLDFLAPQTGSCTLKIKRSRVGAHDLKLAIAERTGSFASWTCDPKWYGNGSCDCGCGELDPDCAEPTAGSCNAVRNCTTVDPEENWHCDDHAPLGWQCAPSQYNSNDGCDCGCGEWDPDCDSNGDHKRNGNEGNRSQCTRCGSPGSFNEYHSGSCEEVIENTNWRAGPYEVPEGWTCAAGTYGFYQGCNCGCGVIDSGCQGIAGPLPCVRCNNSGGCLERSVNSCAADTKTELNGYFSGLCKREAGELYFEDAGNPAQAWNGVYGPIFVLGGNKNLKTPLLFDLELTGDRWYLFRQRSSANRCLRLVSATNRLELETCNTTDMAQHFEFVGQGASTVLRVRSTQQCLRPVNGSTAPGTKFETVSCTSGNLTGRAVYLKRADE